MVDVYMKDLRTRNDSALNIKNNNVAKSVIENRINTLKQQLNLN